MSLRTVMAEVLTDVHPAFRTLDGPKPWSHMFATALEADTARDDLRYLTLGYWAEVAAYNGTAPALKEQQAYCPLCLEEMRRLGGPVYAPLLWSLVWVRSCPKHGISLQRGCPHCSLSFGYHEYWRAIGYCNNCGKWLGQSDPRGMPRPIFTKRDLWDLAQMEHIVRIAPDVPHRPQSTPSLWRGLKEQYLQEWGKRHRFAKRLAAASGVEARDAVSYWLSRGARPSMQRLLDISYGMKEPLLGLLAPDYDPRALEYLTRIAVNV